MEAPKTKTNRVQVTGPLTNAAQDPRMVLGVPLGPVRLGDDTSLAVHHALHPRRDLGAGPDIAREAAKSLRTRTYLDARG